ncbi:MAG: polysaccharide biosynthesis tyrosine autokinase [Nonlabens sp.]
MIQKSDNPLSLSNQIREIFKYWYLFVIGIFLALLAAFLINRYARNVYQATASVMIKDTKSGGLSESGALGDLNILGSSYNTVENEMEVMRSRRLMEKVVEELNLYVDYVVEGKLVESSVYTKGAINVSVLNKTALNADDFKQHVFIIESKDEATFRLIDLDNREAIYKYGEIIAYGNLEFIVLYDDSFADDVNNFGRVKVVVNSIEQSTLSFFSRLTIDKVDRRSSVLSLAITDAVPTRGEDILNKLVEVYNDDAIKDKNAVARKTAAFIQERIQEVQKDLDSIERNIEFFKKSRNIADLPVEVVIDLQESTTVSRNVMEAQTQLNMALAIKRELSESDFKLLPQGLALDDFNISNETASYNSLLLRYKDLLKTATAINPSVIELESQLKGLKKSIMLSIDGLINRLQAKTDALEKELRKVSSTITRTPENERLNRDIERNRNVVEAIYLLLSEKRETTAISLVVTTPKAKVVDFAMANPVPVSPKPLVIFMASLILGVAIPYAFITSRKFIYNKIESRKDIENLHSHLTVLGEIPRLENALNSVISSNDRSILAESFRILRTNLQFKLAAIENIQRFTPVILVTSTIQGEGKTMVSYNLASTLAITGKKVLLLGGDIRNPQIHRYLKGVAKSTKGLTEYLTTENLSIDDIIQTSSTMKSLDIILSGAIPPNPAELLMSSNLEELINIARERYDYIVLDSAPTILVTDTFLINKLADVTVYVTRANFTDRPLLDYLVENVENEKLKNTTVVINDVKQSNFGYGSKYSYTYNAEKNRWFDFFKRKGR